MPNQYFASNGLLVGALSTLGSWQMILVLLMAFAVFWIVQIVSLMSLKEKDFPGPYVRPGWIALFIFVPALSPFAFLFWRLFMPVQNKRRKSKRTDPKTTDTKKTDLKKARRKRMRDRKTETDAGHDDSPESPAED